MKKNVLLPGVTYIVPEQFEYWLESMALEGLYPSEQLTDKSSYIIEFEQREPAKCRYVIDVPLKTSPGYYRHYESYGWSLAGYIGDAVFWVAPYDETRPESFAALSDIKRHCAGVYRRLSAGFVLGTVIMALLSLCLWSAGANISAFRSVAVLCGDMLVFLFMGFLWRIQKKMEIGDRERIERPGGTDRMV